MSSARENRDEVAGQYLKEALNESRRIKTEGSRDREVQRTQTELGKCLLRGYVIV